MAQKVIVELVDDLNALGREAVCAVSFALDGVNYEIDLNRPQRAHLHGGAVQP